MAATANARLNVAQMFVVPPAGHDLRPPSLLPGCSPAHGRSSIIALAPVIQGSPRMPICAGPSVWLHGQTTIKRS
jgi:hypothetical protein